MKLKGIVEIDEADYKKSLELAFIDYLEEDTRTPKLFRDCVIDRLQEDLDPCTTLDEETITQAIEDAKKLITEILKNV